ncbi:hypothetical protein BDW75DRAFT_238252 [Aspergillus navahoensis]
MKTKAESTYTSDDWLVSKIDYSSEDPNVGFVETLYQTCSAALVLLWKSHFRWTSDNPQKRTLKKDIGSIHFWEENFPTGHLNTILAESSGLKIRVLENLTGIGKILIPIVRDYDEAIFRTQNERDPPRNLATELAIQLEKAALILDVEERSEPPSDDETDDDSSPAPESLQNRLGRLHSYIGCLIDLTPVVERYIRSLQRKAEVQYGPIGAVFRLSHRAQPYAMRIRDRFANAPTSLVERLAEANLERSIRLQTQEDEEEEVHDHTNQQAVTLFKPFSLFQDSGLGSSIPTMSQYAATVASHTSFLSVAREDALGRPRAPPLPREGGRPFRCGYCHRTVSMRNRIEWKMHVFADLGSYICTHEDCRDALKTFPTRQFIALSTPELFVEHLAQVHGRVLTGHFLTAATSEARETVLAPKIEDYKCRLCLQDGWQTKKAYSTHVGRHLEEISLACLPRDEEDSGSDDFITDISSSSGNADGPASSSEASHEIDAGSDALIPAPEGNSSLATGSNIGLGVDGMAEATLSQDKGVVEKDSPSLGLRPEYVHHLPTSYWSVPEQRDFPALLAHFGRDFKRIADFMKTKTTVMVKNYYQRRIDSGSKEFYEIVRNAEEKKSRGQPTAPLPVSSVASKRRSEATPSAVIPRLGLSPVEDARLSAAPAPESAYPCDAEQMSHAQQSNFGTLGDSADSKSKHRQGTLPKPVTDILRTWFHEHLDHPYPSEEDKQMFTERTGLTISQISNWFINARRAREGILILHGMIDNGLDANIVTPQGNRRLAPFSPPTHSVQPAWIVGKLNGHPYTASQRTELCVFSQRLGGQSHWENFYVVDMPLLDTKSTVI